MEAQRSWRLGGACAMLAGVGAAAQVTGVAAMPRTSSPVQAKRRIAGIIARPGLLVKGVLHSGRLRPAAPPVGGSPDTLRRFAGFRPAALGGQDSGQRFGTLLPRPKDRARTTFRLEAEGCRWSQQGGVR